MEAPTVLGAQTCKDLGLLARVHLLQQQSLSKCPEGMAQKIYERYLDLFKGLGCLPGENTIKVDSSISPVVHPAREVPVSLKEKIKEELDRIEKAEAVVKQKESTDWVNSMVAVVKPNKLRICIYPRDLNEAVRKEHFPTTATEEVVADMPERAVQTIKKLLKKAQDPYKGLLNYRNTPLDGINLSPAQLLPYQQR